MAVMLIESTDPNFSRYLKKNPNSPITIKTMRQGVLSGWYPNGDPQKYAMYFRDLSTENSFSTEDGKNYLDLTQYASTYFVFNAMTSFFNTVLKLDWDQPYRNEETEEKYIHKITLPVVQLRTLRTLNHLDDFVQAGYMEVENLLTNDRMSLYKISIESDGTFNEFMMRVYLMFYLLHADLYASDIVYMEGMISKVVDMMIALRSPYFLWYWFKKNVLIKHSYFKDLEKKLGVNSKDGPMFLEFGDTQMQRKAFVDKHIGEFDLPILDVGCGEGDYLLPYAKKLRNRDKTIVGVDVDTGITSKLQEKIEDRRQSNATLVNSIDDVKLDELHDIICIEVIEHMPLEDAKELVVKLLKRNFRKLIISTPNVQFNQFYTTMGTRFRHNDHHFEFDRQEFQKFIAECIEAIGRPMKPLYVRDFGVGDQVNGISMAQGCIITKEPQL